MPRLDLKLPVSEHQGLLRTAETIYVLAAPLEDESEVETLRAYSNRQPVTLDAAEPPAIPTLVLIPAKASPSMPSTRSSSGPSRQRS